MVARGKERGQASPSRSHKRVFQPCQIKKKARAGKGMVMVEVKGLAGAADSAGAAGAVVNMGAQRWGLIRVV